MVKIYGTAKPGGRLSRFYGQQRVEDSALSEHLLTLTVSEAQARHQGPAGKGGNFELQPGEELPEWLPRLLEQDRELNELWQGKGKPATADTSRSGFDYSVARRLLRLGYHDIDDLATVLALRPEGSVRSSGKGPEYLKRTIAAALVR